MGNKYYLISVNKGKAGNVKLCYISLAIFVFVVFLLLFCCSETN